ncbi:hypothetical protein [Pedobacter alpinus]|uniref:hypothetical protein n=1 Tax=Pedobacter alpinus TaxID=1590643 RepID=UPI0036725387
MVTFFAEKKVTSPSAGNEAGRYSLQNNFKNGENRKPSKKQLKKQIATAPPSHNAATSGFAKTRLRKALLFNKITPNNKNINKSNSHSIPTNSALFYAVEMQK